MQNETMSGTKEGFRRRRQKRSELLLGWGWLVELVGIVVLVLAFGPLRGPGLSASTLETVTTNLGLIITTLGMLLCLAGTTGGVYYAVERARQVGYFMAMAGAAGQLIGFTWDNILHLLGHTHFEEAHNTAIGGLIILGLASLFLLLNAKFEVRVRRQI